MKIDEFLERIPKIELHLHIEGSIRSATLVDLARKYKFELPARTVTDLGYECPDFQSFAEVLTSVFCVLRAPDDFHRVAYECLQDCCENGVRYAELFFDPGVFLGKGVSYDIQLTGLNAGLRDAQADFGIVARLIPCLDWGSDAREAERLVEIVHDASCEEVIGIGLDFDETKNPASVFASAFKRARKYGLNRTAHAGRDGDVQQLRDTIELLDCSRIDYGYRVLDDESLVQDCLDRGIVFTTVPTNLSSNYNDVVDPGSIRSMVDQGLKVTINSDDPGILNTNITKELGLTMKVSDFNLVDVKSFVLNSIDGAWIGESEKRAWHDEWSTEIDRLITHVEN